MTTMISAVQGYDREKEVKLFDESKIGVKGLVDSGINSIPRFFIHPSQSLPCPTATNPSFSGSIPVVDLSGVNSSNRSLIVDQIRHASHTWGFFQVTHHGIPLEILESSITSIKAFNEQSPEIKSKYYRRDLGTGVGFATNFDLFQSKAASWRDTLQLRLGPVSPEFEQVPVTCRREVFEWDQHVQRLGELLMELLSEGLGLESGRLKELSCLEGRVMAAHYYPYCPQADLTMGLTPHTDPGALTVLLQNGIRGLQVKHGENWVDVEPLAGAITINIGDILQIISNNEYKSVEHRILANPYSDPRISIAVFFNPGKREDLYGPLPELISPEKPAVYRSFTLSEFMKGFFTKELDGMTLVNYFKLRDTKEQTG